MDAISELREMCYYMGIEFTVTVSAHDIYRIEKGLSVKSMKERYLQLKNSLLWHGCVRNRIRPRHDVCIYQPLSTSVPSRVVGWKTLNFCRLCVLWWMASVKQSIAGRGCPPHYTWYEPRFVIRRTWQFSITRWQSVFQRVFLFLFYQRQKNTVSLWNFKISWV